MKFKQFLEEGRTKTDKAQKPPILSNDTEHVIDVLVKHGNKTVLTGFVNDEPGTMIYRGSSKTEVMFLRNSINLESPRVSANTSNEFTLFVSELLPEWKDWPKRNQSFICTTSHEKASMYGYPRGSSHIAFPLEEQDIGVCPAPDMWFSFDGNLEGIEIFNEQFSSLYYALYKLDKLSKNFKVKTKEDLQKIIRLYDLNCKTIYKDTDIFEVEEFYYDGLYKDANKNGLLKAVATRLDPSKNGFKKMKSDKLFKTPLNDNEVWFSGLAAFIKIPTTGLRVTPKQLKKEQRVFEEIKSQIKEKLK